MQISHSPKSFSTTLLPRLSSCVCMISLGALLLGTISCTTASFPGGPGNAPEQLKRRDRMVKVMGGVLRMGHTHGNPDEYPVHEVKLNTFLMDRVEVNNSDYNQCVQASVCRTSLFAKDPDLGLGNAPVVGVTWDDANTYCQFVGKRLPTEAEWEMAARTPTMGPFPWHGSFDAKRLNIRGDEDGYAKTAPVGSFPDGVSGLGVYDMAGNAAEWVFDWYEAAYYTHVGNKRVENPKGPDASTGRRGVRGGSWADSDFSARTTARTALDPNMARDTVGFRCAADVTEP